MRHEQRWTAEKISQQIELVKPLVNRQRFPLPEWRLLPLSSPADPAPIGAEEDDSNWEKIPVNNI